MDLKKWYTEFTTLTQSDIACELGIHQRYLAGIISGEYIPSRELALKIQAYTNNLVTAQELIFPPPMPPKEKKKVRVSKHNHKKLREASSHVEVNALNSLTET